VRLDIDPPPSSIVERLRDGVRLWIVRADINVETRRHLLERTPKHDVFEVLGVGDKHVRHGKARVRRSDARIVRCGSISIRSVS